MSTPGPLTWFLLFLIIAIAVYVVFRPVFILSKNEAVVIERFGQFNRVVTTGFQWFWPAVERVRKVEWRFSVEDRTPMGMPTVRVEYFKDWRIQVDDCVRVMPPFSFTLGDGRIISAGMTVDYQITGLHKAAYVQDLYIRLENLLRSEIHAAAHSLEEKATIDAPALEHALRSRIGTLKWAAEHGLRLTGCALNGFTLTGQAAQPLAAQQKRSTLPTISNESDAQLLQSMQKYESLELDHELELQFKRAAARRADMVAELSLLEAASKGGVANDVLIAYLRLRSKTNDGQ